MKVPEKNEKVAERLARILIKLNAGERLDVNVLAAEFGVSKRTVDRDIDRLSSHLPLQQDEKSKKYFLEQSWLGKLKDKDIQTFARLAGISDLFPSLDMSFLRELLDSRANSIYSAKGYAYEDASQFAELFDYFSKAIAQKQQVAFLYNNELRIVEPYCLIHHHGCWYLAAVRQGQLRTYRLSRMALSTQVHALACFVPDPEIVAQVEHEDSIWIGQEKQEVILTVQAEVAFHFKQRELLPEQVVIKELDDGGLLVSSKISHTTQLLPLVRYWIPHVKIVNPETMQAELEMGLKGYLDF
ncbi:MAG: WYL domain-containing transcriptional regulator [Acinetobacter sp.]|nr:MAG: WYL domain-containing transcriptional regulator [Acinetobacter sp.]